MTSRDLTVYVKPITYITILELSAVLSLLNVILPLKRVLFDLSDLRLTSHDLYNRIRPYTFRTWNPAKTYRLRLGP